MTSFSSIKSLLAELQLDANRYDNWLKQPGFWVSCSYRVRRLRKSGSIMVMLLPIDLFLGLLRYLVSDTKIPSDMKIGSGLYLPHPNGIILNGMGILGDNCSVYQQVTIGQWREGAPQIKNGCAIFGGAKLFGAITIGENCKIGANSVVNINIPDNASVAVQDICVHTH